MSAFHHGRLIWTAARYHSVASVFLGVTPTGLMETTTGLDAKGKRQRFLGCGRYANEAFLGLAVEVFVADADGSNQVLPTRNQDNNRDSHWIE